MGIDSGVVARAGRGDLAKVGVGSAVLALAGCGVLGLGSSGPIEVAGTDSVFDEGRVETACYTFETSPLAEYELNPDASSCIGDVRWVGHDNLRLIMVRPLFESADENAVRDRLEKAGMVVDAVGSRVVDGIDSAVVDSRDEWGIPYTTVYVPLPEGRFLYEGEELRSLDITSYRGDEQMQSMLDAIVDSLELRDDEWDGGA